MGPPIKELWLTQRCNFHSISLKIFSMNILTHKAEEQSTPFIDSSCEAEDNRVVQSIATDELSLSLPFPPDPEGAEHDHDPDYEAENANPSQSPQTSENVESSNPASSKRILLVYEKNLCELMKFYPRCGSPVNSDEIQ